MTRVCEHRWCGDQELAPFEECPNCHSKAKHTVIDVVQAEPATEVKNGVLFNNVS